VLNKRIADEVSENEKLMKS